MNIASTNTKEEIVKKYGSNSKDTGNVVVQIALLTDEINKLTEHLKQNKKDYHSKTGLYKKVSKRSSLLKYLEKNDYDRFVAIKKELKIRK